MTNEEVRLMKTVQGILVRNYVDTQKIEVEVIGSSVYLSGEFKLFDFSPTMKKQDFVARDLGIKRALLQIEREIRSLGEVTHIEMKFNNWEHVSGNWVAKKG
jgi:hypothetical protein